MSNAVTVDPVIAAISAEGAATVIAAAAGTLAVTLIAREPLGVGSFVQQFLVYGGTVALAESAATFVMPRLKAFLMKEAGAKSVSNMEDMAMRAGAVFGISYGLFMLAGTPSVAFAGGAALGSVAGGIAYDSILAGKLKV